MSQLDDLFSHAGVEERKLIMNDRMASETFAKLARTALWNRVQKLANIERARTGLPPIHQLYSHLQRSFPDGLSQLDAEIESIVEYLDQHTGDHGQASVAWVGDQADSLVRTFRKYF